MAAEVRPIELGLYWRGKGQFTGKLNGWRVSCIHLEMTGMREKVFVSPPPREELYADHHPYYRKIPISVIRDRPSNCVFTTIKVPVEMMNTLTLVAKIHHYRDEERTDILPVNIIRNEQPYQSGRNYRIDLEVGYAEKNLVAQLFEEYEGEA